MASPACPLTACAIGLRVHPAIVESGTTAFCALLAADAAMAALATEAGVMAAPTTPPSPGPAAIEAKPYDPADNRMNSLGLLQALCIGLAVKMFGTTGRHAWSMKRGLRALGFPPSLLEPLAQSYVGWELEVMKHLRYELPLPKTM